MSRNGARLWTLGAVLALAWTMQPAQAADDRVEQRLQRLEQQMQQVIDALRARGIALAPGQNPAPAAPATAAAPPPKSPVAPAMPVAPTVPAAPMTAAPSAAAPRTMSYGGQAEIRYYISPTPLGQSAPESAPLSHGRIALNDEIGLHPRTYNVDSGFFSTYRDPSRYRSAGLWLEAFLPIAQAGKYTLLVGPKPAREGGSSVSTTASVRLWVDDRLVLDVKPTTSRRTWSAPLELSAGHHRLRLWFDSVSPGFGPTPLDSSLVLKLQRPGDASPVPLTRMLSLPPSSS